MSGHLYTDGPVTVTCQHVALMLRGACPTCSERLEFLIHVPVPSMMLSAILSIFHAAVSNDRPNLETPSIWNC